MLICNWATSGTVVPRHAKLYLPTTWTFGLGLVWGRSGDFLDPTCFEERIEKVFFRVLEGFAIDEFEEILEETNGGNCHFRYYKIIKNWIEELFILVLFC